MLWRRLPLLLVALTVLTAGVLAAPAVAGSARQSCPGPCSNTTGFARHESSTPGACVRNTGCGGGAVLSSASAPALAILGAGIVIAAVAIFARRRPAMRHTHGRQLATGLFRPPRLSFSS
jgi:hypothetical protein